jgi:hypothetical protein
MFDALAMPMEPGFDAFDALDASDASDASGASGASATPAALRLDPVDVSVSPALPLPELEARLTELAGHLNAATHRFLVLLAEFDRREGWADGAMRSCAHWLGWKCGIDLGAAREKVRVAPALEALPQVSAAMGRGELSHSKVRALTRVATPETEDTLLMIALHGTAHHVEAVVRGYRRARQAAELSREAQQHAGRSLRWFHDENGSLVMQVRLAAEDGAIVLRALERAVDVARADERRRDVSAETSNAAGWGASEASHGAGDVSAETPHSPGHVSAETSEPSDTPTQRRADALVRLAESWLARGDAALPGGERQTLVVHVDARTLAADAAGRSELDGGPVLAAETVRRLGCDASLVAIVEDGEGRILDVGRRTRSIPPSIARALRSRDRGCRYPGCTHTRFVDGHHVEHWARGGATRLSNLVLLCRRHHRLVHEGGATVRVLDDGAIVFTDALGRRLVDAPVTRGSTEALVAAHRRDGPHIDPDTAPGRWAGEDLDLGLAVEGLLARVARRASAAATAATTAAPAPPTRPAAPPSRG